MNIKRIATFSSGDKTFTWGRLSVGDTAFNEVTERYEEVTDIREVDMDSLPEADQAALYLSIFFG